MAIRLIIKTSVFYADGKLGGGQEFAAIGPTAPKTLLEIFEKLKKQFYHPEDQQALTIKQAGVVIGGISKHGYFMDAEGFNNDAALNVVPQYDLRRQFPDKYPESKLYRFFRRQEGTAWEMAAEEVHTEESAQSRVKTLRAITDGSFKFHCRVL